jgi:hypothetical protein
VRGKRSLGVGPGRVPGGFGGRIEDPVPGHESTRAPAAIHRVAGATACRPNFAERCITDLPAEEIQHRRSVGLARITPELHLELARGVERRRDLPGPLAEHDRPAPHPERHQSAYVLHFWEQALPETKQLLTKINKRIS